MHKIRALVAAAGRGSRAGLPYPKTLYPVQGKPILIRIMDLLKPYDAEPTVIASPQGERLISESLRSHDRKAHVVVQHAPRGMGDAVLCFEKSPAYAGAEHVLLVWGDIPLIQTQTVDAMVAAHLAGDNDFTFVTRAVDSAYTLVDRDTLGNVVGVRETREAGVDIPEPGERDIGLFVFRKQLVLDALGEPHEGRIGARTGEHGFLYVIAKLTKEGRRVVALPIAHELDLVSLNSMSDLHGYV